MHAWVISFAVLLALVSALCYKLKGKISIGLQYALCTLVLLQLLVPISLGSRDLGLLNVAEGAPRATVKALEVTNGRLEKYSNRNEVVVDNDKYSIPVLFTTDSTIHRFRVFRLTWDTAAEKLVYATKVPLYQQDKLTPERPLALYISFPGSVPPIGIDYVDADGTTRSYHVTQSGMDGSVLLQKPYQQN